MGHSSLTSRQVAHLGADGTQGVGGQQLPSAGDAAGGDDGDVHCVHHLGHQGHGGGLAHVAALSVPSAMTASAPRLATSLARATAATTGITLAPDSFQAGMKRVGSPAPVVITATFSSAAMAAS